MDAVFLLPNFKVEQMYIMGYEENMFFSTNFLFISGTQIKKAKWVA